MATTLGAFVLAEPSEYEEDLTYRGGTVEMASGAQKTDLVQSSGKRTVKLTWSNINGTQKGVIESALAVIKDTSGSFTDPNGATFNVTASGLVSIKWRWVRAATGFRYSGSVTLREV